MFPTSTQRKYWTFSGETELQQLRKEANERFILKHQDKMTKLQQSNILNPEEEHYVYRFSEMNLKEVFKRVPSSIPRYVLATALCYSKRFYLHNSVMDYDPYYIMYTCLYLSFKVEELNVHIDQYVGILRGDQKRYTNIILTFEPLVIQKLHYHLIVHNPFKALRGLLLDLKTRSDLKESVGKLGEGAEKFIEKSLFTDACLIFAPSQIALAALQSSASKENIHLDSYLTSVLLKGATPEELKKTVYQIKRIKYLVKSQEPVNLDRGSELYDKLCSCRNQENIPDSEEYKRKLQETLEEDEERQTKKRQKIAEEEKKTTKDLLGIEYEPS